MSTKILDPRQLPQLQPANLLWQHYRPENAPYRFQASTRAEAEAWQERTQRALEAAIGFQDLPPSPIAPQQIEVVDRGGYLREKWLMETTAGVSMPFYILVPKQPKRPLPVVLAFNGHGYGVKDIVGLWEDGTERYTPDGYQKDFGVALCQHGFLVAAPEISCFGERQTDFTALRNALPDTLVPSTCQHTAHLAFHLGGSVVGLRVFDAKRLLDYLQTRPDADCSRLGAMGISGGGLHTFYSACLDRRIRACVISGYYSTYRDSILAMDHCPCNFIPGLHQFGEMYDLVGLIAPRPLLVEAGSRDPIFPIESVKRSVEIARSVYRVFGAEEQVETDFFEGRHSISGARAYDFLKEKLSA